jgi:hypothetical protein
LVCAFLANKTVEERYYLRIDPNGFAVVAVGLAGRHGRCCCGSWASGLQSDGA